MKAEWREDEQIVQQGGHALYKNYAYMGVILVYLLCVVHYTL